MGTLQLAVDFQATPKTPVAPQGGFAKIVSTVTNSVPLAAKKPRPASMMATPGETLTTFESVRMNAAASQSNSQSTSHSGSSASQSVNSPPPPDPRKSRRSLSFDFRGFSIFGSGQQAPEPEKRIVDPALKPFRLQPSSVASPPLAPNPRKIETQEDEDDARERERLRATMKLMGIEAPKTSVSPLASPRPSFDMKPTASAPLPPRPTMASTSVAPSVSTPTPPQPQSNRWSFFRRNTSTPDTTNSTLPSEQAPLTADALAQAEAESHLAALDAREKQMKEEIARGAGSGFTEIAGLRRSADGLGRKSLGDEWRSRRSSASFTGDSLRGIKVGHSGGGSPSKGSERGSIVFNADDEDAGYL